MTSNSIYLASTILHLYVASTIALQRPNERAHLVIIDQPAETGFPVLEAYTNWQNSPFHTVRQFFGRHKSVFEKLSSRRKVFKKLDRLVKELEPGHIFVGNDRRIEFQQSMAECEKLGIPCIGHYMDEGVFTYTGRKASSSLSDRYIETILKKLTYGIWWKYPPTIGGSGWITEIHIAFPNLIHPLLKQKQINHLDSQNFQSEEIKSLSAEILKQCDLKVKDVSELDAILTLPHESIFKNNPGYAEKIQSIVSALQKRKMKVAVKYHPRNSGEDVLSLKDHGVQVLPSCAVLEALLTILPTGTRVIGDMSSTMLITRWLREDMPVYYLENSKNDLVEVLDAIGAKPLSHLLS